MRCPCPFAHGLSFPSTFLSVQKCFINLLRGFSSHFPRHSLGFCPFLPFPFLFSSVSVMFYNIMFFLCLSFFQPWRPPVLFCPAGLVSCLLSPFLPFQFFYPLPFSSLPPCDPPCLPRHSLRCPGCDCLAGARGGGAEGGWGSSSSFLSLPFSFLSLPWLSGAKFSSGFSSPSFVLGEHRMLSFRQAGRQAGRQATKQAKTRAKEMRRQCRGSLFTPLRKLLVSLLLAGPHFRMRDQRSESI